MKHIEDGLLGNVSITSEDEMVSSNTVVNSSNSPYSSTKFASQMFIVLLLGIHITSFWTRFPYHYTVLLFKFFSQVNFVCN